MVFFLLRSTDSKRQTRVMSLSSNGRTLIKGYPVKDTVSTIKIPCQGRDPGSNPGNDTKFRMRTANSKIQLLIEK